MAFAFPSLAALPVFYGPGFGLYLVSCAVGFAAAFIMTLLLKYEEPQKQENVSVEEAVR